MVESQPGPFVVAEWQAAAERDRGLENCFYHLGTEGERRGSRKEKGETAAERKAQLVARA